MKQKELITKTFVRIQIENTFGLHGLYKNISALYIIYCYKG